MAFILVAVAILCTAWTLRYALAPRSNATAPVEHSRDEQKTIPPVVNQPWEGRSVDKIRALHGLAVERVAAELDEPNQIYEFSIEDGVDSEFRVELLNTYPPGSPRSKGVRIREWQWKYRDFTVAVWFHSVEGRWVVLDTCRWKKGVKF
jgi:hypothetical protein